MHTNGANDLIQECPVDTVMV